MALKHALGQPLREARREARRHDGELECPARRAGLVREKRGDRRGPVRLHRRQHLERAQPVAVEGMNALIGARGAVDDQRRAPTAGGMRLEDRAGRLHLELEGVVRRDPDDRPRVSVEEDGGLVARRILELLDHQVPAPRRGRPVHAPQRLSLLVVAHRVEVEAGRPAEEKPAPFERARAGVREERVEVDEPRVDEHRLACGQRDLGSARGRTGLRAPPSPTRSDSGRAEPRRGCTNHAGGRGG